MNPNHPRHHAHVFSLTEDIEKTHYSYDLITGPGFQSTHRDLKCSRTLPPCRRCRARLDEYTRGLAAAKGEKPDHEISSCDVADRAAGPCILRSGLGTRHRVANRHSYRFQRRGD